jgi:hypothetical protein
LCPFGRAWSADREPSLWTGDPAALAAVLRLAGCAGPVLEVGPALLDRARLPARGLRPGQRFGVLLAATATVASAEHRAALNRSTAAAVRRGRVLAVASADELAALPELADLPLSIVERRGLDTATAPSPGPVVVHDRRVGYLAARVPSCGAVHVDQPRVHARQRGPVVTFSLPGRRRPTLLDIVPPGAGAVRLGTCDLHATAVLIPAG